MRRIPELTQFDFDMGLADVVIEDSNSGGTAEDSTEDDPDAIASTILHFKTFPRAISDTDTPDGLAPTS